MESLACWRRGALSYIDEVQMQMRSAFLSSFTSMYPYSAQEPATPRTPLRKKNWAMCN